MGISEQKKTAVEWVKENGCYYIEDNNTLLEATLMKPSDKDLFTQRQETVNNDGFP